MRKLLVGSTPSGRSFRTPTVIAPIRRESRLLQTQLKPKRLSWEARPAAKLLLPTFLKKHHQAELPPNETVTNQSALPCAADKSNRRSHPLARTRSPLPAAGPAPGGNRPAPQP